MARRNKIIATTPLQKTISVKIGNEVITKIIEIKT